MPDSSVLNKPIESKYQKINGLSGTKEYKAWMALKLRCNNPNDAGYKNYGGRGITVCDEWINSFIAFYNHIGPAPSKEHCIDRINNELGYEPGNVQWTTYSSNIRNRRLNKTNKSGIPGVSFDIKRKVFVSKIYAKQKQLFLGHFTDLFEACCARKSAENKYW